MRDNEVIEFGPIRTIGPNLIVRPMDPKIPTLWQEEFIPRMGEIQMPEEARSFGICRSSQHASEGEFEYIAATEATLGADVPEGMIEVLLPREFYYVARSPDLSEIGATWGRAMATVNERADLESAYSMEAWKPGDLPAFEVYPHDFSPETELFVLLPVRKV